MPQHALIASCRYSWLIETLVASVYGGGFIVMTPQLFINYRLKSVAHLPWKFFMCVRARVRSHCAPPAALRSLSPLPTTQPFSRFALCRYKALNTFIDDLFAFIIKMPTLHRMSCFRDDIVFMVFLYQRWVYRVDKSRMNEFGQKFDEAPAAGNSGSGGEQAHAGESKKSK